jgi:protein TonB
MTESTVHAERFEPQSSAALSYTWVVPQKPVSVRIPFALIDRLEHEAMESFRSLHSRGSEIGGFLLAYVSPGDPAAVSIEDYELVACDYSRGPLYRLSDADRALFEREIEQRRAAGDLVVAGFFRSHTRKGLALDADDLALFKTSFSDPRNVALLIRPFATKASVAGLFIWEDGAVRGDASYLEFPFRSSELTPSKPVEEASPPVPEAAQPAPPEAAVGKPPARAQIVPIASRREMAPPVPPPFVEVPAAEIAEPAAVAATPAPENNALDALPSAFRTDVEAPAAGFLAFRWSAKMARMAVLAAAQLVVIVLLFVYPGFLVHRASRSPASPQQDSSPLALRVEHSGGELMLTWNRESTAIKSATRAVLAISDGAQHENVDMDLAQLRNGSIVYSPSSSDIVFRMEVMGSDQTKTTSESVRVLRTRPSPMPEPGQQAQGSKGAPAPSPAKPTGASIDAVAPDSAAGREPAAQAEIRPSTAPAKPFNADSLSQRLRPVRPTDMPDAPEAGRGSEAVSAAVAVGMNSMPPPLLTSASPAPAAASQSAPVQAASTARTNTRSESVQQAQLLSRRNPEYPPLARQASAHGEVVLTAVIGVDGKVKDVKVVSGHPLLRNAAVAAVKQWVYSPTILNGKPVESESRIVLNFVPR